MTEIVIDLHSLSAMVGEIIATDVSLEDYMEHYADEHCEWVEGVVIRVSLGELKHNRLIYYLITLLEAYFELRPLGQVIGQPFVLRLAAFPRRRREPDLLVVLKTNPHELKDTYMDGPADICIEVVSQDSVKRDYGEKLEEYEQGGVSEYWIVDPLRKECRFSRLGENQRYATQPIDAESYYHTPLLPGFALHVATLWQETLPGPGATVQAVRAMLNDA